MRFIFMCCQIKEEDVLNNFANWIIPFLLGLFASFFLDFIRTIVKNSKNRKFIKFYLKDSIYENLPKLKTDYETIKKKIEAYRSDGKNTISAHEDFNTTVLDGISSVDYYAAFGKQFVLLNEIISIIRFLNLNLPSEINNEFYHFLDSHLKEKDKTGDMEHVLTCNACKQKQEETIEVLVSRIRETEILREKIGKIIKKRGTHQL